MRNTTMTLALGIACALPLACNSNAGVGSEIATSVVSGALNNTNGSSLGYNDRVRLKKTPLDRVLEELNPNRTAWAASWMCSGGTLSPTFDGAAGNPYTYTPVSCSVDWDTNKTASSKWSSTFTLAYGSQCDTRHGWIQNQVGGCSLTRTTATGGNTRSLTGPTGNSYSVTHDTNGAGTGWDSTVSPAPTNAGVVLTCADAGCSDGLSLVINGSHLTGTVQESGGSATTEWDHTITSGTNPLTVTGDGLHRVVSGSVTVQHNLLKFTSTTTFNNVGYGDPLCCFPTSGSVTTTFNGGTDKGKSESLSFSAACGEATLTTATGGTTAMTLQHCI